MVFTLLIAASTIIPLSYKWYSAIGITKIDTWLACGQFGAAIAVFIVAINIPRRPDVYNDKGELVDRMRTTTIYSRYTYGWASELLWKAAREGRLDEIHVAKMDSKRRAIELESSFAKVKRSQWLMLEVFRAHAAVFISQLCLTFTISICNFAPQFFLYR